MAVQINNTQKISGNSDNDACKQTDQQSELLV